MKSMGNVSIRSAAKCTNRKRKKGHHKIKEMCVKAWKHNRSQRGMLGHKARNARS